MASQSNQTSIDIKMEYLCQHWIHSFEEQQDPEADEDQIYRPKDFKVFEARGWRGRETYVLYKNGDGQWLRGPGPDDRSYFDTVKWRVNPNDKSILQIEKYYATQHVRTETYRIVELTKDRLRMTLLHGVNDAVRRPGDVER